MSVVKLKGPSISQRLLVWAGAATGVALIAFAAIHWNYYLLPEAEKAVHPAAESLSSSGRCGLSFGLAGAGLIFLNLSYLIRRQWLHIAWLGPLRTWMTFHVVTGFIGGAFVLLHSNFLLKSALGSLACTGLAIVLVTGIIGRYFYSRVPRSLEGKELEIGEIQVEFNSLRERLATRGLSVAPLTETGGTHELSFIDSVRSLVVGSRESRAERQKIEEAIRRSPELARDAGALRPLVRRYTECRQWIARYDELRNLMGSWRFFHRWFAIVMLATVAFHIILAFMLGDLWIVHLFRGA